MFIREESIHIEAPTEAVYDYLSDIRRHPEWAAQKLSMREIEGGRLESIMTLWPLKVRSVIHIETAERPRRFVYVSEDELSTPHRWRFDITPESGGSRVKFSMERMTNPLLVRIMQPALMWPIFGHPGMLNGLRNIKRTLERETQPAASNPS